MDLQFRNSLFVVCPPAFADVPFASLLPRLLEVVGSGKVRCAQTVGVARFRFTFVDSEACDNVFREGLTLDNSVFRLFRADPRFHSVYIKDLPWEVPDQDVSKFLSSFGKVSSHRRCVYKECPSVFTGTREFDMLVLSDIPASVRIGDHRCRVSYFRQPRLCSICSDSGHLAPSCPLSGRCRVCHQPGHVARECRQARGPRPDPVPAPAVLPDPVPVPVSSPVPVQSAPVSSVSPVPVPVAPVPRSVSTVSSVPVSSPSAPVPVSTARSVAVSSARSSSSKVAVSSAQSSSSKVPALESSRPCPFPFQFVRYPPTSGFKGSLSFAELRDGVQSFLISRRATLFPSLSTDAVHSLADDFVSSFGPGAPDRFKRMVTAYFINFKDFGCTV